MLRLPGKRGRYNATPLAPLAPLVNTTTLGQSPAYPVKELGPRVLPWLFNFMASVPEEGTIIFAKIDLSDGFWRMLVAETDKWNFAYVLPQVDGQPLQLVISMPSKWGGPKALLVIFVPPPKPDRTFSRHSPPPTCVRSLHDPQHTSPMPDQPGC
jgi:hypothetical protein